MQISSLLDGYKMRLALPAMPDPIIAWFASALVTSSTILSPPPSQLILSIYQGLILWTHFTDKKTIFKVQVLCCVMRFYLCL